MSANPLAPEQTGGRLTDLEVAHLRADFPILDQKAHGKPLAYLDNANTTQKPRQVIDAESRFYATDYAGVHRAVYDLAERSTRAYEASRNAVRRLLNAPDAHDHDLASHVGRPRPGRSVSTIMLPRGAPFTLRARVSWPATPAPRTRP